ncbi:MAG: prenyltransferase/squalene oxidase repeat-containing protein [Pseudomonadota bacterium]
MKYDDVPLWHRANLTPSKLYRYRAWRKANRQAIFRHYKPADDRHILSDEIHLNAALNWLLVCQDQSSDQGFTGRYRLDQGWTTSYPETTGYIIPTLFALAEQATRRLLSIDVSVDELNERAVRAGEFLVSIQLPSGAFPAGEVRVNLDKPSPFNTAQIINGLQSLHSHTGEEKFIDAAIKAANWLLEAQDNDGAWRQWFYHDIPASYCSHLACFVAELGCYLDNQDYLASARANANWVLDQQDLETGFFDKCGFTEEEQHLRIADLHTLAYNQAGLLRIAAALADENITAAAKRASDGVLDSLVRLGWLPGVLDHQWRAKANSTCVTGCAQMALVWMEINNTFPEAKYLSGARRAIDIVKRAQLIDVEDPGLAGAIPGSDPLWGWYNDGIMPNWAAKFFIDALIRMRFLDQS